MFLAVAAAAAAIFLPLLSLLFFGKVLFPSKLFPLQFFFSDQFKILVISRAKKRLNFNLFFK